jgi:hypothetical protein
MQLRRLLVRLCQKAGDKELVDCASLGFGEFFDIAISISCAVSFVRLSQLLFKRKCLIARFAR